MDRDRQIHMGPFRYLLTQQASQPRRSRSVTNPNGEPTHPNREPTHPNRGPTHLEPSH